MPFLRRFVASVVAGEVSDLKLPILMSAGEACVAEKMNEWDKAVRVPFLGHMTRERFELFDAVEPTMKAGALLALTSPVLP